MPYASKKQRAWMHVNKPKIAAKWDRKYGGKVGSRAVTKKRARGR